MKRQAFYSKTKKHHVFCLLFNRKAQVTTKNMSKYIFAQSDMKKKYHLEENMLNN